MEQLSLPDPSPPPRRGGRRAGAGRPRTSTKVPHGRRPELKARHPVHAILRVRKDVTNLRSGPAFSILKGCFKAVLAREGFRLAHFSVQSNHVHLIVEAQDEKVLARAMQSLSILIAKRLNQALSRGGPVFEDHYYAQQMKSPAQVRHTLRYVFKNVEHHSGRKLDGPDSRASEMYLAAPLPDGAPVVAPKSWLLTIGWRRAHGGAPRGRRVGLIGVQIE